MFITKFLDRKETRLAAMCVFTTFTASTYVDLIKELELRYVRRSQPLLRLCENKVGSTEKNLS
jgi:hypothetical protein